MMESKEKANPLLLIPSLFPAKLIKPLLSINALFLQEEEKRQ